MNGETYVKRFCYLGGTLSGVDLAATDRMYIEFYIAEQRYR